MPNDQLKQIVIKDQNNQTRTLDIYPSNMVNSVIENSTALVSSNAVYLEFDYINSALEEML